MNGVNQLGAIYVPQNDRSGIQVLEQGINGFILSTKLFKLASFQNWLCWLFFVFTTYRLFLQYVTNILWCYFLVGENYSLSQAYLPKISKERDVVVLTECTQSLTTTNISQTISTSTSSAPSRPIHPAFYPLAPQGIITFKNCSISLLCSKSLLSSLV